VRPARAYAATLRSRGKHGGIIACALAHRAGRIGFALVRDQAPYDPAHWEATGRQPNTPAASCVAPSALAAVRDLTGRLLLVRRWDTGDWELPGRHVDPGESASDAAVQETAEESGMTVEITGLSGLYTDPGHVIDDPRAGLVRQPFAVCFHARLLSGSPGGDQVETRWRPATPVVHHRRHPRLADPPGHAAPDRPRTHPRRPPRPP